MVSKHQISQTSKKNMGKTSVRMGRENFLYPLHTVPTLKQCAKSLEKKQYACF